MASPSISTAPRTDSSASVLRGGSGPGAASRIRSSIAIVAASFPWVVAENAPRRPPLPLCAALRGRSLDLYRHHGRDGAGNPERDPVLAEGPNRLVQLDLALVDRLPELLRERLGHVGGGHGPVEPALLANLRVDLQRLGLEPLGDLLGLPLLASQAALGRLLSSLDLFQGTRRGRDGEPTREEIIARIAIRHLFDLACPAQVLDVFAEDDFHDRSRTRGCRSSIPAACRAGRHR